MHVCNDRHDKNLRLHGADCYHRATCVPPHDWQIPANPGTVAANRHLSTRWKFSARRQSGFTLLELMVVTLILAILAILAAGPFMRAREKAMMVAAKGELRNALRSVEMYSALYNTLPRRLTDMNRVDYREGPQVIYCTWQHQIVGGEPRLTIVIKHRALKKGFRTYYPQSAGIPEEIELETCTDVRAAGF
jgi:prepilin-type N-terminal cleavage/methylation domain-containing protein